jgi:hypothetical protein
MSQRKKNNAISHLCMEVSKLLDEFTAQTGEHIETISPQYVDYGDGVPHRSSMNLKCLKKPDADNLRQKN